MFDDASLLLWLMLVTGVGATVQGSLGFGLSLISVPFLVLIDPILVPGPLLVAGTALTLLMTIRDRRSIRLPEVGWAMLGRVVGTAGGAAALAVLPARELALSMAGLVLLGVAMTASGLHLRPTSRVLVGAGFLSGVMGTTASIAGPPMAIVYQRERATELRAMLASNLLIGSALSLIAIAAVGRLGRAELGASVALVPGVLVGFLLSLALARYIDGPGSRYGVLVISTLGALAILAREL